jgi:hypothetical protein
MLETDAGVPRELFKERLTERLPHAAARKQVHVVTSTVKHKDTGTENTDGLSDKAIIICR